MFVKFIAAISANRRLWTVLVVFAALPFLIKVAWRSSAQSPDSPGQERTLKMKEHISVPLKVNVRNLQSKEWLKDLEIEVKNVGKKPIYSIVAYLMLPDDKTADSMGIPLDFGNPKNIRLDRLAEKEDPHIDPGESYIFKIDENLQKGFANPVKESPEAYMRVELWFEIISFGDGTGLVNGSGRDHRKKASIPSGLPEAKKKVTGPVLSR